ncbi:MAG: hypothetical protein JWQ36_152 [Enterovirga sp.]|jgi:hypothetical protein|nr:hypothetical protein [Enterovirga sp.]
MLRSILPILVAAVPAAADEIETAHMLASRRPQAFAAYQAVLPKGFEGDAWIRILDGVSEPIRIVRLEGKDYALGFSCKPHDCGENGLAFLAALDGSRAVVVLKSEERTEGRVEVYGRSTPAERTLLKEYLRVPR